jgi:hypothetical protein
MLQEAAALRDFHPPDVRFTPKSGIVSRISPCLLCANSGHNAVQQISTGLSSIFAVFG